MFSDSQIANSFKLRKIKCACLMNFSIVPCLKKKFEERKSEMHVLPLFYLMRV